MRRVHSTRSRGVARLTAMPFNSALRIPRSALLSLVHFEAFAFFEFADCFIGQ